MDYGHGAKHCLPDRALNGTGPMYIYPDCDTEHFEHDPWFAGHGECPPPNTVIDGKITPPFEMRCYAEYLEPHGTCGPKNVFGEPGGSCMFASCEEGFLCSDDDNICVAPTCAENERVLENACVPCPAGTVNEAGDANSPYESIYYKTYCDAVLCGENERVIDNTCVACEQGWIAEAGQDASGADTQCENYIEVKIALMEPLVESLSEQIMSMQTKLMGDLGDLEKRAAAIEESAVLSSYF